MDALRNSSQINTAATLLALILTATSFSAAAEDVATEDATAATDAAAETAGETETQRRDVEVLTIIGSTRGVEDIAGAAYKIDEERIQQFEYPDINRILRDVPGLYLQEEDGFGQRPNIGIRGSGSDRSSRIALLEDGVLIAPAPYAAPSAYYFPTAKRMRSVEVLKGPSSIEVGPRTTGGAINMRSTEVPDDLSAFISAQAGTDDAYDVLARFGGKKGVFGFMFETVQQDFDGFKELYVNDAKQSTGFNTQDYQLKLRLESPSDWSYFQAVELKLGRTDHDGDETYLGLTEEDFAANPYYRYTASQLDNIKTQHEQTQLTYMLAPAGEEWDFSATIYNNEFARNWFKLAKVNGVNITDVLEDPTTYATELSYLQGTDSPDDALVNRNNARTYYSRGVQAQLGNNFEWSKVSMRSLLGVRFHKDEEDRFQDDDAFRMDNGVMVLTDDGEPGSATNRVSDAEAASIFWAGDIDFGKWKLEPGIRYEKIRMTRNDYDTADPDRGDGPTRVRKTNIDVFIPGLGAMYYINDNWSLLGGVFKGYNPPAPGSSSNEESSINYEFGTRWNKGTGSMSAVAFYNDYSNIVGTVSASTGGDGNIGDQYDGGKAKVAGLEFATGYTANNAGNVSFPLQFTYTWTPLKEFRNSFESDYDPWGEVEAGDELPYIPEHKWLASAGAVGNKWETYLNLTFTDKMRTVAGSGTIPAEESTDSYHIVDIAGKYHITKNIAATARIDNLLDNEYLVARRPAGLRPGKPRQAFVGVQLTF